MVAVADMMKQISYMVHDQGKFQFNLIRVYFYQHWYRLRIISYFISTDSTYILSVSHCKIKHYKDKSKNTMR